MPTPLIVIGAILLFLLLLLTLPVRIVICCRETVILKLKILCFGITLFPRKKKAVKPSHYTPKRLARRERRAAKRAARKARRAEKKRARRAERAPSSSKGHAKNSKPTLTENVMLIRALVAALIRKTGKHLRLKAARLHIRVATGDAAKTALLYGAVSGSLAILLDRLSHLVRLKTKPTEMSVYADYLSERSTADVKLVFAISPIGAIALLTSVILTFIRTKRAQKAARRKKAIQKTEKTAQ